MREILRGRRRDLRDLGVRIVSHCDLCVLCEILDPLDDLPRVRSLLRLQASEVDMRVAVIGSGNVGGRLGRALANVGHDVVFGVRDVEKTRPEVAPIAVSERGDAVKGADVVILATPAKAVDDVLNGLDVGGKVLVDCTNPVAWAGGPTVADVGAPSQAEKVARLAPGAKVVKGFSTFGAEHIDRPQVDGKPVDTFLAADDADAKRTVAGLAEQIGFRAVDAGPLRNARLVEHLAVLWIHLATQGGLGRSVVFQVRG